MIFNMNSIYIKLLCLMAAILGAISVITAVESLTSHVFSMLYTLYQLLPEYVEEKKT